MNKAIIAVTLFLVFGGLLVYQQTSEPKIFATRYFGWIGHLFGNVKDVTGHAVEDYTWLPEKNRTALPQNLSEKYQRQ